MLYKCNHNIIRKIITRMVGSTMMIAIMCFISFVISSCIILLNFKGYINGTLKEQMYCKSK